MSFSIYCQRPGLTHTAAVRPAPFLFLTSIAFIHISHLFSFWFQSCILYLSLFLLSSTLIWLHPDMVLKSTSHSSIYPPALSSCILTCLFCLPLFFCCPEFMKILFMQGLPLKHRSCDTHHILCQLFLQLFLQSLLLNSDIEMGINTLFID